MEKPVILIAKGNEALRRYLSGLLRLQGLDVIQLSDNGNIARFLQSASVDLVIVGSSQDAAWEEIEVARQIRKLARKVPIMLITANSSEELAVTALKAEINDYFKWPFSVQEFAAGINRCLSDFQPRGSGAKYEGAGSRLIDGHRLIGESPSLREIKAYIGRVASTDSNVLLTGETGTGKELAAELIHRNSPRYQKPFVSINCAAIPDSLLESELFGYEKGAFTGAYSSNEGKMMLANGGTVFFDEIGDMSPYAQAKILRAVEGREVQRLGGKGSIPLNVKVITATNKDLEGLMSEGKFRKDLYFRLNVARIHLPPLRDRREDIRPLLAYYIRELNHRLGREVEGLSQEALDSFLHYDWPGNVRELKNLLEASFINLTSETITLMELPAQFRNQLKGIQDLPQCERDRLLTAILSTNWNMSKAAQKLHWSRMTIYRKMARYHIVRGGRTEDERAANTKGKL